VEGQLGGLFFPRQLVVQMPQQQQNPLLHSMGASSTGQVPGIYEPQQHMPTAQAQMFSTVDPSVSGVAASTGAGWGSQVAPEHQASVVPAASIPTAQVVNQHGVAEKRFYAIPHQEVGAATSVKRFEALPHQEQVMDVEKRFYAVDASLGGTPALPLSSIRSTSLSGGGGGEPHYSAGGGFYGRGAAANLGAAPMFAEKTPLNEYYAGSSPAFLGSPANSSGRGGSNSGGSAGPAFLGAARSVANAAQALLRRLRTQDAAIRAAEGQFSPGGSQTHPGDYYSPQGHHYDAGVGYVVGPDSAAHGSDAYAGAITASPYRRGAELYHAAGNGGGSSSTGSLSLRAVVTK
jgi:hypothetical protein